MCENKDEKLQQAELMAKNKICYDKCVCPKLRVENKCGECAVFANLSNYYLNYEVGKRILGGLDRWSWEDIGLVAKSGKAEEWFFLGDEKKITLYSGEKITVVIVGFNHDNLQGGGKAGITFALKDVLNEDYYMNCENTNVGGWRESKMRTEFLDKIYRLFPEEVRCLIKPVIKITGVGNGKGDTVEGRADKVEQTIDKLFLFSGNEVEGTEEYFDDGVGEGFSGPEDIAAPGEGKQYPYFVDRKNYAVYRNGERESWWVRSPHCGSDWGFCYYYRGSELDYCGAEQKSAVRFGFCI